MSGIILAMVLGTAPSAAYQIVTPVYEGPLDLLLQLIERAELDITLLALAQVTDQFLEYLHAIPENSVADVSSFLVIASKLVQIKSEALLPRPPRREPGEEDPGAELARQLRQYKRFKELAGFLAENAGQNRTFARFAPPPHLEGGFKLEGVNLNDLLQAAQYLLTMEEDLPTLDMVVSAPRYTIREKIGLIARYLRQNSGGTFSQLFGDTTQRLEVVVTFLAFLELIKRHMLRTEQSTLFGPIAFEPDSDWDEDLSFELEFGE
jgi:segregation and condensation protein A